MKCRNTNSNSRSITTNNNTLTLTIERGNGRSAERGEINIFPRLKGNIVVVVSVVGRPYKLIYALCILKKSKIL